MVFVFCCVDFWFCMVGYEMKLMIFCLVIGLFVGVVFVLCVFLMDMFLGFVLDMCGGDDFGMGDFVDVEVCEFLGLM